MLTRHKSFFDGLHLLASGILTALAYTALHAFLRGAASPLLPLHEYLSAIGIIIISLLFTLSQRGFSTLSSLTTPSRILQESALGFFLALLTYGFVAYLFRMDHLSRRFLLGGALAAWPLVCAWHLGAYAVNRWRRRKGWGLSRILLVGDEATLPEIERKIRQDASSGFHIAGKVNINGAAPDIGKVLDSEAVEFALFTTYRGHPESLEKAMLACQERGVQIWLRPDFLQQKCAFSAVDFLGDVPLFVLSMTPPEGLELWVKRLIDVAASALMLAVLALPMAVVALLIRLTSPGPAIFRQKRIGKSGAQFDMYKFRSMFTGAEGEAAYSLRNEMSGPAFKMRADPRITPLGRVLRKYSIDELPQFWNVLKGEMSLVGPRPPLPSEVDRYEGWQKRRLSMSPGITGLWQVLGRKHLIDFDDWVKLDLEYIDNWSLWLDLKVLLMTIPAVVRGTGV